MGKLTKSCEINGKYIDNMRKQIGKQIKSLRFQRKSYETNMKSIPYLSLSPRARTCFLFYNRSCLSWETHYHGLCYTCALQRSFVWVKGLYGRLIFLKNVFFLNPLSIHFFSTIYFFSVIYFFLSPPLFLSRSLYLSLLPWPHPRTLLSMMLFIIGNPPPWATIHANLKEALFE